MLRLNPNGSPSTPMALLAACENACGPNACCTPKQCKQEAKVFIALLVNAWSRNYGNGPHNDNDPGAIPLVAICAGTGLGFSKMLRKTSPLSVSTTRSEVL